MNTWMIALGALIVWIAVWVTIIRPWMRDAEWAKPFFDAIEPIETALWRKSESILWARTLQFVGVLLSLLTFIGSLNLEPFIAILPDEYRSTAAMTLPLIPLLISVLGAINERLRRDTSEPLEVVAVQTDATPEVKRAVENFEAAKQEVKAVIADAPPDGGGGDAGGGDGGGD